MLSKAEFTVANGFSKRFVTSSGTTTNIIPHIVHLKDVQALAAGMCCALEPSSVQTSRNSCGGQLELPAVTQWMTVEPSHTPPPHPRLHRDAGGSWVLSRGLESASTATGTPCFI